MLKKFSKQLVNGKKKGFTLVEILTVVALIAILFVIFVPRLDFSTNKVRETGVQSDFRSYQLAFEQVARQNSGYTYADDDSADGSVGKLFAEQKLANAINSYLDKKLQISLTDAEVISETEITDPWGIPYVFAYDSTNDSVYLFSAGADKIITSDSLENLKDSTQEGNADNYSISVTYTTDGLNIKTTGFDNNIDR